ncbi:hypothetical protein AB886_03505 [Staphylococcus aureus]|nr:hypothetical protein AB886_03505 [Staphylococcus aureus]
MVTALSDVNNTDNYGAGQIQVLEGLEAVRKRPGMYIGSTSERGLHHLVWEIVDNSIDEALAGYANKIEVVIEKDNWIKVTDNGRGIPVDIQEKMGRPAVEVILTVLHAGGKFGGGGYKVSGGLHGVGSSVVNALSQDLEVYVHRNETIYHQAYKKGVPQFDLKEVGTTDKTGTVIRFKADGEIFTETTVYNYETLQQRIRELAFLNKGIQITLRDERDEENVREDSYHYEGGIKSYVELLNENKEPIHDEPIYIHQSKDDIEVEIAIQYNSGYATNLLTYANNIHTYEGGTHEDGFKRALTRVLNSYGLSSKIMKEEKDNLTLQIHNKQLRLNKNESELKLCRDLITEFETLSKYNNITNFEVDYKKYVQDVNQHQELSKEIEDKLMQLSQRKLIEQNNLNHYENQLETYNNDLELNEQSIEMEMSRLNLTDDNDINEIIAWRGEQEELEQKRDTYKKRYHEFEMEIARLESLTKDKELLDSDKLKDEYEQKKEKMNTLIDEYSAVHYQCQNNINKTQSIVSHINYLNQELKDQQEIFQLAEIVSGKNNKNLTLENFVLIYYLDQIIAQANLRLATMSDNRYQLIRREAVSHGLSGLEIDVFDLHSNKSRHISSLSGGETFQSSLALALGLSEIVQQQSGGISLESIFIDEGFGTLDQETLETALDTLLNLKSTGRMVGIISHVSELKNRIPLVLEVKSDQYQSSTRFKRN